MSSPLLSIHTLRAPSRLRVLQHVHRLWVCLGLAACMVGPGSSWAQQGTSAAAAEGAAAGQSANTTAQGQINTTQASSVVPNYTTSPPQSAYYGQRDLSGQAASHLANCTLTPNDPTCQAQVGAMASANTPRAAISPYDPSVLAAKRITGSPGNTLEDIASYYSGCQVTSASTPTAETRICRRYNAGIPASCSNTLNVAVTRTSSCTPGDWFAHAGSGSTGLDVQCIPDRSTTQQHFRVTVNGGVQAIFDVDMTTPISFPRKVAQLSTYSWDYYYFDGAGILPDNVWVANNQCVGDSCQLTALIASDYRTYCTNYGRNGYSNCSNQPPFIQVLSSCPAGTLSGDNIYAWYGYRNYSTTTFDPGTCWAPGYNGTPYLGTDIYSDMGPIYWYPQSTRTVLGWTVNPLFGPVPQMTLQYTRPHMNLAEVDQWDNQCVVLDASARCSAIDTPHCVDGPSTKLIDGVPVTRACWKYETNLSCAQSGVTDECTALISAGCTAQSAVCSQVNPVTGLCDVTDSTYSCPVPPGTQVAASNCPSNVFCLGGSCFNTSYTGDADFAKSMTYMEAAREAGVYIDTNNMQVFKGEANSCRDRLFVNCCSSNSAGAGMSNQSLFGTGSRLVFDILMNSDNQQFLYQGMQALLLGGGFSGSFTSYGVTLAINGTALPAGSAVLYAGDGVVVAFDPWSLSVAVVMYAVMSLTSCSDNEGKLAMKEGAGLCHTIGSYCSDCISLFGSCISCIEHTTGKCCFNSRLARIINEQGRGQFGRGWGSPEGPDCSGFTVAQLQQLNFAAMDLTEFYASIVPTLPNVGALQGRANTKASNCYYGQGKCQ